MNLTHKLSQLLMARLYGISLTLYNCNNFIIRLYFQPLNFTYNLNLYCINNTINIMNETYELSEFMMTELYSFNLIIYNCINSIVRLVFSVS